MKKLLLLLLFCAIQCHAASGPSISGLGISSNTVYRIIIQYVAGQTNLNLSNVTLTGWVRINGGQTNLSDLRVNGDLNLNGNANVSGITGTGTFETSDNIVASTFIATNTTTGYYGNGGGLSNLAGLAANVFISNVTNNNLTVTNNSFFNFITVSNNSTFNGKVTFNSNVYVMNLFWFTNVMSTITVNAAKAMEVLATNNNISITGYSGIDGTNANAFTRIFTNTAGASAVKTIALPAGTLVLSSPYSTTLFNTNQGILSGVIYPGFGTNVTWVGN